MCWGVSPFSRWGESHSHCNSSVCPNLVCQVLGLGCILLRWGGELPVTSMRAGPICSVHKYHRRKIHSSPWKAATKSRRFRLLRYGICSGVLLLGLTLFSSWSWDLGRENSQNQKGSSCSWCQKSWCPLLQELLLTQFFLMGNKWKKVLPGMQGNT